MSLGNLIKVSEQGSLTQHSASRVSRCESGEDRSEGVVRKIKRGRKTQSRAESSGIGKVILEGGTMLEDAEIVACNQLLFWSQEAEARKLWSIGNELGVLDMENRERVISQFEIWENRDEAAAASLLKDVSEEPTCVDQ